MTSIPDSAMAVGSISASQSPRILNAAIAEQSSVCGTVDRVLATASLHSAQSFASMHQQPGSNNVNSNIRPSCHAKDSLHDSPNARSTTSAKPGKLRFSRHTAAARKAPPPMEMIHEDEFPPPDERNARQQMTIDQLRRNDQLVEYNHKATLAGQHPCSRRSMHACTRSGHFSQSSAHEFSSLRRTQVRNDLKRAD